MFFPFLLNSPNIFILSFSKLLFCKIRLILFPISTLSISFSSSSSRLIISSSPLFILSYFERELKQNLNKNYIYIFTFLNCAFLYNE